MLSFVLCTLRCNFSFGDPISNILLFYESLEGDLSDYMFNPYILKQTYISHFQENTIIIYIAVYVYNT